MVAFERNLQKNLNSIREELVSQTYRTSPYETFFIHDPKEREIYRLPFRDRVVHHAVMNVLEGIWVPVFISQTYSCVKGKGIHGALKTLSRDLKDTQGTQYCLKMDIRKYYPSVAHEVLKSIVRKKIKDKRLLRLLDGIIDSAPGTHWQLSFPVLCQSVSFLFRPLVEGGTSGQVLLSVCRRYGYAFFFQA